MENLVSVQMTNLNHKLFFFGGALIHFRVEVSPLTEYNTFAERLVTENPKKKKKIF